MLFMIPDGFAKLVQAGGNMPAVRKDRANMRAWYYQLADRTVAYAELSGEHGERVVGAYGRVYFIISGAGEFFVNGGKLPVSRGSVIPIPAGATYNFHAIGPEELTFVVFLDDMLDLDAIPSK